MLALFEQSQQLWCTGDVPSDLVLSPGATRLMHSGSESGFENGSVGGMD